MGFSLAHFLEGLTGLTVTVLSIGTLFLLMMLTGRIRWSNVLAKAPPMPPMASMPMPPAAVGVVPSPYDLRPG